MLHQTGSGVLGPVFRAFDPRQDTLVAIKAFRLDVIPEQVVRFADALRRLAARPADHPALVPIIDVGLERTTPYLVMPHQSGPTLDVVVRRLAPMPIDQALPIIAGLAEAIDAARRAGVGHGALHPRDIFVPDDAGGVRVTGFGITQALESAGLGGPLRRPYVAPERAHGRWDVRADLYALGVIAHELLTGRRPSGSGEQDGVFAPDLTASQRVQLRRVLAVALAEDSERRHGSGAQFVLALEGLDRRAVSRSATPAAAGVVAVGEEPTPRPAAADAAPPTTHPDVSQPVASPAIDESSADGASVGDAEPCGAAAPFWTGVDVAAGPFDVPTPVVDAPMRAERASRRRMSPWLTAAMFAGGGLAVGALAGLAVASSRPAVTDQSVDAVLDTVVEANADTVDVVAAPAIPAAGDGRATREDNDQAAGEDARPAAMPAGRIVVRSQPSGALVTIDGRPRGGTPVVVRDLAPGTYDVGIAHPGHVPRTERVTLGPRASVRTLTVRLTPGLEPAAAVSGAIDVDSRPRGARVVVDGRFVGHAPLRLGDVVPGEHLVRLELAGYEPATVRVVAEGGQPSPVRLTLRPLVALSGGYGQ